MRAYRIAEVLDKWETIFRNPKTAKLHSKLGGIAAGFCLFSPLFWTMYAFRYYRPWWSWLIFGVALALPLYATWVMTHIWRKTDHWDYELERQRFLKDNGHEL